MKKLVFMLWVACQLLLMQVQADTIVAIHGFITDWRSMIPIEKALEPCGFDVYLWEYQSRRQSIDQHASDLNVALQRIAATFPGRPIHFVTHSIGALVLRMALNRPDCPPEALIGRAVLLAPPNQGSILARRFKGVWPINFFMGEKSGWQLTHYGPRQMAYIGEFPSSMSVLVVAGTKGSKVWFSQENDGYLIVDETKLNTPHCFECFPVSHGDILKNSCVLSSMKKFIYGYYYPESAEADPGSEAVSWISECNSVKSSSG